MTSDSLDRRPIRRALISVADKSGLPELARALADAEVSIVSTGSTAKALRDAGVAVTTVEEVTGFPECLDGRVKTLHPRVHAGLLADRRRPEHLAALSELDIEPFDLLVGNLYPFRETVAAGADFDDCVEQIDIGGPAMIRAAAKNHASVAVVVDPSGYPEVVDALAAGGFDLSARRRLATVAFAHTARYDIAVANYLGSGEDFPSFRGLALSRLAVLRYGENPHQAAALYLDPDRPPGLAAAEQLQGKAMSYNNYVDADAALRAAHDFTDPAVVIVKHTNPCGIALADDVAQAHRLALACDPVSAFGGVIATNRPVSGALAQQVSEVFTEVLVAPGFDPVALDILSAKPALRLLVCTRAPGDGQQLREISGGFLAQERDLIDAAGDSVQQWVLRAGPHADPATLAELTFAWRAVRAVKSNAILLSSGRASVGIGMGQVNRVDAARLAVSRAGDRAAGAVAASDAFFPFPDGLMVLAEAGVRAVVCPGGSVRDAQVAEAAESAGVSLYFTGTRHFNH